MDEARMFTFAPGGFTTNDLLLRPAGPNIVSQPQANVYVWDGGAAPFTVTASFDASVQYQWRRGGINVAAPPRILFDHRRLAPADNGSTFDCILYPVAAFLRPAPRPRNHSR